MDHAIKVNSDAAISTVLIGDGHKAIVVDDFLKDPQSVIDHAVAYADRFEYPPASYPGGVLQVPMAATDQLLRYLRREMTKHFPIRRGGQQLITLLSMTTFQPDELSNLQRLCHTDPRTQENRANYACLVYLFEDESLGGTGFYRWKQRELLEQATALEQEDPLKALAFLQKHFAFYNEPASYLTDSNDAAELLEVVPAKFNRFVFYSGDVPHSAHIEHPEKLSKDFRKGRLTLNGFASVVPAQRG